MKISIGIILAHIELDLELARQIDTAEAGKRTRQRKTTKAANAE
jgi:hypothetical protein